MDAYVINLDHATDRLAHIERIFRGSGFTVVRVPAIDGNALSVPFPDYSEFQYRWFHGRVTNPLEIGCYMSHFAAFSAFLASGEEHVLICEDDIVPLPDFAEAITSALDYAGDWDILRLSGLVEAKGATVRRLSSGHNLSILFSRLKGAGAYVINRRAAKSLRDSLLPMRLPLDHAIDREWYQGLRAVAVLPFPISQTARLFRSSIQGGVSRRLGWQYRLFTTYPYQAFNEVTRYCARALHFIDCRIFRGSDPQPAAVPIRLPVEESDRD